MSSKIKTDTISKFMEYIDYYGGPELPAKSVRRAAIRLSQFILREGESCKQDEALIYDLHKLADSLDGQDNI